MPLVFLIAVVLTVGSLIGFVTWRYPRAAPTTGLPTLDKAREVGKAVGRHPNLRGFLGARVDPAAATGLALTLAMVTAICGGVLVGVLAYLVRANSQLAWIDNGVAKWGNSHATATSTDVLNAVTQLGSIYTVIVLCVVLAVAETIRERSYWVAPFIVAVIAGEEFLHITVKVLADRVRPTFNPAAATLGPSFPSGHSTTAAAFYATAALLIGRWRGREARAVLAGLAAGIAVAVAATRVLLDVHWLSDVVAGLALGWAWFAICAIAFGGRILRFGAAAETAARAADATEAAEAPSGTAATRTAVSARSPSPSR
jgi:membrane-associated phospholipid phosphatase